LKQHVSYPLQIREQNRKKKHNHDLAVPFSQTTKPRKTRQNIHNERRTRDGEEGMSAGAIDLFFHSLISRSPLKRKMESPHGKEAGKQTPNCGRSRDTSQSH